MSTINTTNLKNPSSGSNNVVLNADGTSTLTPSNIIKSGTAVASTSGTSIDFTGIPSWVKRVTVMFSGVSTNGTSNPLIQIGDAGGIETTGYAVSSLESTTTHYTTGFGIKFASATAVLNGSLTLSKLDGNVWVGTGLFNNTGAAVAHLAGSKTLSDTLTQFRITTVNGTDQFDAGTVNILMEG